MINRDRSRNFWLGGVQALVQKGLLNFLWQITSHGDNHVFLNLWTLVAVGAGNTVLRAEANRSQEAPKNNNIF